MLLPSFFVVGLDNYNNLPDIQLPENAIVCFNANFDCLRLIDSLYSKFFLQPKNYPFCLLIDFGNSPAKSETTLDKLIDFMITLSFHSKYIKTSHDNPLFLFENISSGGMNDISIIREAFKGQGYNDIESRIVCDNHKKLSHNAGKSVCFRVENSSDGLFSKYIDSIKEFNSSNMCCLFFLKDPRILGEVLVGIDEAEAKISEEMPQTYYLLKENTSLSIQKQELLFEIDRLQEQLDSLSNYHLYYDASDTRYKRQITELLRFYKSEYEILPIWYKRFGHIIKVLMGKRTFRSLFNDNVKKYRD